MRPRSSRPGPGRGMWVAAGIVGAICGAAFVVMMLAEGTPPAPNAPTRPSTATGVGFSAGLLIGLAVGIVIGLAIARAQRASRASHSSRSSP